MKKSSEVLGLKVIGIQEGQENGIAQDFMIDTETKKIKYLVLKTSTGYGFRVMEVSDVEAIGADYIITNSVENAINIYESKDIMEEMEKGFFILGTTVLSSSGNVIGTVSDFTFDTKTGIMDTILLDDGNTFDADIITTLAGKMVFVDEQGGVSDAEQKKEVLEEIPEEAVETEEIEEVEEKTEEEISEDTEDVPADSEEISAVDQESIDFLLGKTVKSEVVSDDGMLRLEEGTELTEEIINLAKQHDAILTLTLSV